MPIDNAICTLKTDGFRVSCGTAVLTHLSTDEIIKAKENTDDYIAFFEAIYETKNSELLDFGKPEFNEFIHTYAKMRADCIGDNKETMEILVSQSRSELERTPVTCRFC